MENRVLYMFHELKTESEIQFISSYLLDLKAQSHW